MAWYMSMLRGYDDFTGRARRRDYWLFLLANLLLACVTAVLDFVVGSEIGLAGLGPFGTLLMVIVALPSLALGVRRLHDSGRSGWWMLVSLVPFIGVVALLVLMVLPGTSGPNEYGPDPRPMLATA